MHSCSLAFEGHLAQGRINWLKICCEYLLKDRQIVSLIRVQKCTGIFLLLLEIIELSINDDFAVLVFVIIGSNDGIVEVTDTKFIYTDEYFGISPYGLAWVGSSIIKIKAISVGGGVGKILLLSLFFFFKEKNDLFVCSLLYLFCDLSSLFNENYFLDYEFLFNTKEISRLYGYIIFFCQVIVYINISAI
ncbi:hypothetical protein J3Q64DRAFT_1696881 [Phycomyces blakesleeanus]|uniref:Uncharacterized protein n=1 Tax=Phycomyces blakesleeanus TaxID=4837 RepID=A0ABR3B726_PHYBL